MLKCKQIQSQTCDIKGEGRGEGESVTKAVLITTVKTVLSRLKRL